MSDQLADDWLSARLVAFLRLARANEFHVGIGEQLVLQQLLADIDVTKQREVFWAMRSLVCSSKEDWQRFEELFHAFWKTAKRLRRGVSGTPVTLPSSSRKADPSGSTNQTRRGDDAHSDEADVDAGGSQLGASDSAGLIETDFRELKDDQRMRAVEQLAQRLAQRMRQRMLRRQVASTKRGIDLRRTARACQRYGGVPLKLAHKQPLRKTPKVIVMVDVSRSMAFYSLIFLRFARGLLAAFREADAFAFHTRLTPIGDALKQQDFIRLQHSLVVISQSWSGGTRIGDCLAEFNQHYRSRLERNATVIMISDGLDTGEADKMASELALIKNQSRRLIWLSPLLGRPGYEAKTASMMAALPHIDLFAPAHNIASLMALENQFCNG